MRKQTHIKRAAGISAVAIGLTSALTLGPAVADETGVSASQAPSMPAATSSDPTRALSAQQLALDWHVPLTEALARVDRQHAQSELLDTLAAQDPSHFGGGWVDQADGGMLVINSTDSGQADLAAFTRLQVPGLVRVDHAAMNLQALNALADKVDSTLGGDERVAVGVDEQNGGGVDVAALLVPGVAKSAAADSALAQVALQFGSSVHVIADQPSAMPGDSCTSNDCNPPLRGGTGIAMSSVNQTHAYCTLGFNVISRTDSAPYELTAGHCLADNTQPFWYGQVLDTTWHLIGQTWRSAGNFTSGVDAGILTNANPAYWQAEPAVYVRASNDVGKQSTTNYNYSIEYASTPPQGIYVCHSGATSGTHCGRIGNTESNGRIQVSMNMCAGDSGGPVFADSTAYGILSGGFSGNPSMVSLYDGTTQWCMADTEIVPILSALSSTNTKMLGQ